jgi:hypothetical protein
MLRMNFKWLHANPWPDTFKTLNQKYQILLSIDMLDYDFDLDKLYKVLLEFADYNFMPNQRIVITQSDTDVYVDDSNFGFTLWNIYNILAYLDIPGEHVIYLHHHTQDAESKKIAKTKNISSMQNIYNPYVWLPLGSDVADKKLSAELIQYPYMFLSGIPRSNRQYTMSKLIEQNLHNTGLIAYHNKIEYNNAHKDKVRAVNTRKEQLVTLPESLHLRTTRPWTRIYEHLVLSSSQKKMYFEYSNKIKPIKNPNITTPPALATSSDRYQPNFNQLALWDLVVETVGDYPYAHLSEKSIKSILSFRPFIIIGGPGQIRLLKDLGFKTFDNWIDESYDNKKTFANRTDSAIAQLSQYCSHTSDQLKKVCIEMHDVLEYNYNHYINNFAGSDYKKFLGKL